MNNLKANAACVAFVESIEFFVKKKGAIENMQKRVRNQKHWTQKHKGKWVEEKNMQNIKGK